MQRNRDRKKENIPNLAVKPVEYNGRIKHREDAML